MGSPTLVLIIHFAAEKMLTEFLNQGCERPSSGSEWAKKCSQNFLIRGVKGRLPDLNVTSPQMQQNASDEFMHFLGILMVQQTLCTSETITH